MGLVNLCYDSLRPSKQFFSHVSSWVEPVRFQDGCHEAILAMLNLHVARYLLPNLSSIRHMVREMQLGRPSWASERNNLSISVSRCCPMVCVCVHDEAAPHHVHNAFFT